MLVENQQIEIKWSHKVKRWYVDKGYNFTEYGDVFFVKAEDLPPTSKRKVKVKCDYCGKIFEKQYCDYINEKKRIVPTTACRDCNGKKKRNVFNIHNADKHSKLYNQFITICEQYGYQSISKECRDINMCLEFVCPKHGTQYSTLSQLKDRGCLECQKEEKHKTVAEHAIKVFAEECEQRGYIPLATIEDYESINSLLPYKCPIHGIKKISLSNMKRGRGCNECGWSFRGDELRLTKDKVRKKIQSKNGNEWLNEDEYVNAITPNLKIRCGSCSNIFTCSINNYDKNKTGKCPNCNERSIGEYRIAKFLDDHNISYTQQEHFNGDCRDIKPLPFDFYLPDYNLCIEFDGEHHYRPVWGEKHFIKTILHDGMKNNYCRWNNINLLRIPYWEGDYIEQILTDKLDLRPAFKQMVYKPKKRNTA